MIKPGRQKHLHSQYLPDAPPFETPEFCKRALVKVHLIWQAGDEDIETQSLKF